MVIPAADHRAQSLPVHQKETATATTFARRHLRLLLFFSSRTPIVDAHSLGIMTVPGMNGSLWDARLVSNVVRHTSTEGSRKKASLRRNLMLPVENRRPGVRQSQQQQRQHILITVSCGSHRTNQLEMSGREFEISTAPLLLSPPHILLIVSNICCAIGPASSIPPSTFSAREFVTSMEGCNMWCRCQHCVDRSITARAVEIEDHAVKPVNLLHLSSRRRATRPFQRLPLRSKTVSPSRKRPQDRTRIFKEKSFS